LVREGTHDRRAEEDQHAADGNDLIDRVSLLATLVHDPEGNTRQYEVQSCFRKGISIDSRCQYDRNEPNISVSMTIP
jgi:hypothetical protein